jgi:hypothetical protein
MALPILDMLKNGELPEVKVEIQNKTIISFALATLIVASIVILINYLFKRK